MIKINSGKNTPKVRLYSNFWSVFYAHNVSFLFCKRLTTQDNV